MTSCDRGRGGQPKTDEVDFLLNKKLLLVHIILLIRDVAKLLVLLSLNFSDFFSTAVPYSSLIFSPLFLHASI